MRTAYERGASIAAVGEKFGVSEYIAKRMLVAAGAKIRKSGPRKSLLSERRSILREYKAGVPVPELAEKWGVTRGRIYQVMGRQRPR